MSPHDGLAASPVFWPTGADPTWAPTGGYDPPAPRRTVESPSHAALGGALYGSRRTRQVRPCTCACALRRGRTGRARRHRIGFAEPLSDSGAGPGAVEQRDVDPGSRPQCDCLSFVHDVLPSLTRQGCNAGACHGKASGQNGFKLSLLGFDPEFDHLAITREAGGRRILRAIPEQSLLLQKATARVPHGGGRRIDPAGPFYETLRRWIVAG